MTSLEFSKKWSASSLERDDPSIIVFASLIKSIHIILLLFI
jgi:hypothetical protein